MALAQLQAEASCPICLDYLRDACWEGLQDIFPCPVCLQPCPDKGIRRNSQLCHMIDFVKQLPNTRGKRKRLEEKPLREKHKQVLSLFYEKDLELLCLQCRVSSDHRHHPLAPIEQAAACHRRRLKVHIEPLKKQLEDAEKSLEMQASKSFELVRKVNNQRRELHSEVECIKHFLGTDLKVSQDRKTATFQRMEPNCVHNPEAFTSHLEVLSSEGFDAGRHFWQVEEA
uniref:Tripartite motif-containing protein 75 n=1 Tax=Balaenoptera musculus TaxID=9771 RepID=A0A8C0C800_BALMU